MKFSPLFALAAWLALVVIAPIRGEERVLTKAIEVRSLSVAEAQQGLPVHLRGVVVFVDNASAIFVQDETSTTFFRLRSEDPLPAVGDEIELTATTRMGLYLPGIGFADYHVLGRRALPPGIPVHYDDLHFGRYHYQRVTVEGIVHSVTPLAPGKSLVRLAMGSRVLEVHIETPPLTDRVLVDSRVRITGLAVGLINAPQRQLVQPYVRAIDWSEVEVVTPALPAAEAPKISAEELLAFRVTGLAEQRVRLEGVVAMAFGGDLAYLLQGDTAFAVRFGAPVNVAPGDRLTVVGFPAMDRFNAAVIDAQLLTRAPGPVLRAIDIPAIDTLYGPSTGSASGTYDGHLVRLVATLHDASKTEDGTNLLVSDGKRTLSVRVPEGTAVPPSGSIVRLTGICQVVETVATSAGFTVKPGLISVRAALPDDLEILSQPPWWTVRRLAGVLAALAGVIFFAGLWIVVLRRQVIRQTAALRQRIETQAALEERQRIAREFHDTLEQELAGVSLRLDVLATRDADDKARGLIAASRNLVSRIQAETRDLIGDLRDSDESAGDLRAALEGVATRYAVERGADVRLAPGAALPVLPSAIVHALRMVARESIANALNHGHARVVMISIEARAEALTMRVDDDGGGFDPAVATQRRSGHFGCEGIRERVRKIGGSVVWRSELQRGTTVEVTLPLSAGRAVRDNSELARSELSAGAAGPVAVATESRITSLSP